MPKFIAKVFTDAVAQWVAGGEHRHLMAGGARLFDPAGNVRQARAEIVGLRVRA